jgi:hypothetical protein
MGRQHQCPPGVVASREATTSVPPRCRPGYLTVDFGFSDRATHIVYLSVIIRQDPGGWRIIRYQVSHLD